jgi:hypothetical protein
LEGLKVTIPMMSEFIDEESKLEPLLPQIKKMADGDGLPMLHEVDVV